MTGAEKPPAALVLVASSALDRQLHHVRESGWLGRVVVVGSRAEASALGGALEPATLPEKNDRSTPTSEPPAPAASDGGQLRLDPDRRLVVSEGGRTPLSALEYDVLRALLLDPGAVCRFADLTGQVWGTRSLGDTAQVHAVVERVRRKLDSIASPLQVQSVRGVGFRAVPNPKVVAGGLERVTGE